MQSSALLLSPAIQDNRGRLIEIGRGQVWKQVSYTETVRGQKRGNHYHRNTVEVFYIIKGLIRVHLRDLHTGEDATFVAKEGQAFKILPYELHTVFTLEDTSWITLLSEAHDPDAPDIFRVDD